MLSIYCFFGLILYLPVNNFSVVSGQVFLGSTSTQQQIRYVLGKDQGYQIAFLEF